MKNGVVGLVLHHNNFSTKDHAYNIFTNIHCRLYLGYTVTTLRSASVACLGCGTFSHSNNASLYILYLYLRVR